MRGVGINNSHFSSRSTNGFATFSYLQTHEYLNFFSQTSLRRCSRSWKVDVVG